MLIKKGGVCECGGLCDRCNAFEVKVGVDGMILTKRKVSSKYIPPDTQVLKMLMARQSDFSEVEKMTDGELLEYEKKILARVASEGANE